MKYQLSILCLVTLSCAEQEEEKEKEREEALEKIKKLEAEQRQATTDIATNFPELNDINRIVLDFETSLTDEFMNAPGF